MMKKYTLFFVILSSIILAGCESKHDQLYKACQDLDFELAHQILGKMDCENDYDDAIDALFLFERESTFLLEQNTDEATKRIELLLNELPRKLSYYEFKHKKEEVLDRLLQKAAMLDNVEIIKFIVDDYVSNGTIALKAWNYLDNEHKNEDLLSYFANKVVDMHTDFHPILYKDLDEYEGKRDLFEKVFDKCIETGNFSIAKKLIDHLDSLKRLERSGYDEGVAKTFISFYQQKYNDAIKKKKRR